MGTGAHAPGALLATAASLFPDPLQTANSEMLLNTADPLSSINSTITILDTFEERERQASSFDCKPSHGPLNLTQSRCLGLEFLICGHAEVFSLRSGLQSLGLRAASELKDCFDEQ